MPRFLHSLQFRLVLAFATALALALAGVSVYSALATQREIDRFEQEVASARASRLESMVTREYDDRFGLEGLQPALQRAAELFDWRISLESPEGRTVVESRPLHDLRRFTQGRNVHRLPVVVSGEQIGQLVFQAPGLPPELRQVNRISAELPIGEAALDDAALVEPQLSRLASSFNRSLIFAGLAAGAAGIGVIGAATRRTLRPVRALTVAAGALGSGDLSQRVPVDSRDEIGVLGSTFNDMATRLEDSEELRRTLTADIAHELRTPLSNLQGYLEAIRDRLVEPDAETIGSLHSQVLHLSRLVEDLRMLALMESGAFLMEKRRDRLDEIAQLTVDSFQPRAADKSIELALESDGELPDVEVDRTRVRQVIGNLLENAITHTPDGGSVSVAITRGPGGESILLAVTDTGPGIPEADLPHIFDRLYRVDPSRARTTGGAGLGLTIVRQLVEAHSGSVSADNVPDGGARLVIELPAAGLANSTS